MARGSFGAHHCCALRPADTIFPPTLQWIVPCSQYFEILYSIGGIYFSKHLRSVGVIDLIAGKGFADGEAACFNQPSAVAVDGINIILVADFDNHRLRMIAGEGALVTTLAGSSEASKVDGEGVSARFSCPSLMALDERGRLLVIDEGN